MAAFWTEIELEVTQVFSCGGKEGLCNEEPVDPLVLGRDRLGLLIEWEVSVLQSFVVDPVLGSKFVVIRHDFTSHLDDQAFSDRFHFLSALIVRLLLLFFCHWCLHAIGRVPSTSASRSSIGLEL